MTVQEQQKEISKIPFSTNHTSKRLTRHSFFENITTELQAYMLGLALSDGSVNEKRKTFTLGVSVKDEELINLFKDQICPEAYIRYMKRDNLTGRGGVSINDNGSVFISITSAKMFKDLAKYNVVPNKTNKDLDLPDLGEKLNRHLLRGFFDGDGCITGWVSKEKGKVDRFRYSFDISSKGKNQLKTIVRILRDNDIHVNINYISRDDMYRIKTSNKKEISKLFDFLYSDSNFYLSRKFNKFNEYVNTEVTTLLEKYSTVTHSS